MPSLLFQIFYNDDPGIVGVDLAHLATHVHSVEQSDEFWGWAQDFGYPSGMPDGDPDAWVNVVEPADKGDVEAFAEKEWPVSRRELAAFRAAFADGRR
jgi:hypothetical protein